MLKKDISLKEYNTFGVKANARYFYTVKSTDNMKDVLEDCNSKGLKVRILGGGSNILFTKDIDDAIVYNCIQGIKVVEEDGKNIVLEVGAGIKWHDLVTYCVQNCYQGLENLALIPGMVGAAPVQNIGAYGVEQKACFYSLDAINIKNGDTKVYDLNMSKFKYRDSIFKNKRKGEYCITSVRYKLKKNNIASHVSYKALIDNLGVREDKPATIEDVYRAVIELRQSKLPNPALIGNAGSFFKNPIVSIKDFTALSNKYGEIPYYEIDDERVKIPAAYLIEASGWKGYRKNDVGVHKDQALVIVNYGDGTAKEIIILAEKIQHSVLSKYDIHLEPEINIW